MAASAVLTTALVASVIATSILSCGTTGLIACAVLGGGAAAAAGGTVIGHFATNTSFVPVKPKEKPRKLSFLSQVATGVIGGIAVGGMILGGLSLVL